MSLVTKENIKVGMKVYSCWDDTPIDGFGCVEAIIKEILSSGESENPQI